MSLDKLTGRICNALARTTRLALASSLLWLPASATSAAAPAEAMTQITRAQLAELNASKQQLHRILEGFNIKDLLYLSEANEINRKYMAADTIALVRPNNPEYQAAGWAGKVVPVGLANMLRLTSNEDQALAKDEPGELFLASAGHNDKSPFYRILSTQIDPKTGEPFFDLDADPESLPQINTADLIKDPKNDLWILPAKAIDGWGKLPHFDPANPKPIYKGRPMAGSQTTRGEIVFSMSGKKDNVSAAHRWYLEIHDTVVTGSEPGNPLRLAGGVHRSGDSGKAVFRAYFNQQRTFLNLDIAGVFTQGVAEPGCQAKKDRGEKCKEGYLGSVFVDAYTALRGLVMANLDRLKRPQTCRPSRTSLTCTAPNPLDSR